MTEKNNLNLYPPKNIKKDAAVVDKGNIYEKDTVKQVSPEIIILIEKKILFFQDVIQKTILHVHKNKMLDIFGISEVNSCINTLTQISQKIKDISSVTINSNTDNIINILQNVNNELSTLFKLFGTESFEDLLWICFGNNSVNTYTTSDIEKNKFELLKKYFHPTGYKILAQKKDDKKDDDELNEKSKNLDCIDIGIKFKQFHLRVYGIQVVIHNPQHNKSLVITGIIDDVIVDLLNNRFINIKNKAIKDNIPIMPEFQEESFQRFVDCLCLKEYLIYEPHEIYLKFSGINSNINNIRQKTISQTVKDFISYDLFIKRLTIIHLLIKNDKYDNQYLAYLLYDMISNDVNSNIDTQEQTILFDSFPWPIKQYFKDAMKNTVQYTNNLSNFDIQKIPLEQQICLLKATDCVKEKAMQKLKEVKAKSEDSGSKARQYLEGLLKIPFNVYRKEPILNIMNEIKNDYMTYISSNNGLQNNSKTNYTSLEILKHLNSLKTEIKNNNIDIQNIKNNISSSNKTELLAFVLKINEVKQKHKLTCSKIKHSKCSKNELVENIHNFIDFYENNNDLLCEVF